MSQVMAGFPFPDPHSVTSLTEEQVVSTLESLIDPGMDSAPKADFLDALHRRGETAEELALFARALLAKSVRPGLVRPLGADLVELCGTGGDRAGYLNISTAAMFVAAGAGAGVLKHGNRAFSSKCGSADVLEALGVNLHLDPDRVGEVLGKAGCVFLLASDFHPAVAALGPLRRKMAAQGKLTVFNLLGPLLNPGMPDLQLTGIYDPSMLPVYAGALGLLGRKKAWAVHGGTQSGGIDELSVLGATEVHEVSSGSAPRVFSVTPEDAGIPRASDDRALTGGDAPENASRILGILRDEDRGAARDMVVLNAAAALHLAGLGATLAESAFLASESIRSGAALASLRQLRDASAAAAK